MGRRPFALVASIATLTTCSLIFGACSGNGPITPTATPPAPIRIGAVYNLMGSQAPLDVPSLDGAYLAVDRINAAGGLLGHRVELVVRNGDSSPAIVASVTRQLTREGVSAIVGLSDTDQVLAAAPIAARAGIPFVTSGATSPRLIAQVPKGLFMTPFGDNVQAAAAAEYASRQLGAKAAAVFYDADLEYSRLLAGYFAESWRAWRGTVAVDVGFRHGETADQAVARLLRYGDGDGDSDEPKGAKRYQLIYLACGPDEAGQLVNALRAKGVKHPIMGGDSFDTAALVDGAAGSGGKVYYTTHAFLGRGRVTPAVRRFEELYRAAYGHSPESAFAALGYDAVNLVASAITRAASAAPDKVQEALRTTRKLKGVTGTLSYSPDAQVPRKQVAIIEVAPPARLAAVIMPRLVPRP